MKPLKRLFKRAQAQYLQARIVCKRPDLKGLPFIKQLRTFAKESIDEHLDEKRESDLPRLVVQVLAFEADKSVGYYRAQAMLFEERSYRLQTENSDLVSEIFDLRMENRETYRLAVDATKMIQNSRDPEKLMN